MSNHKEKPPQVTRGQYIHLPQDTIAEEPSPPKHHVSTHEPTPSQTLYMETSLDEAMAEAEAQDDAEEGVNPKDLLGIKKPNLFLVPPAAEIYLALAMQDGAAKYGPFNWREKKVKASIYIAACKRHINKWVDGLENAEDSGAPELAHALACLAIIVDAYETGNLADDRPLPGSAAKLLAKWTKE